MRIVALDVVRFFAAMGVVLYHYVWPNASVYDGIQAVTDFGYLGVPLFFIVSGYVISISANNRSAVAFIVSRLVRLYPALWVSVGFTVLVMYSLAGKTHSWGQVLANLTLINEYLGFNDVDGVYWTLKAELKFYACVFLLLVFGVFQRFRLWLSIWLMLVVLHAFTQQPFFLGWFITPNFSSYFIAGVALFLIQQEGRNRFNQTVLWVSLLISSIKVYQQASGFMVNPSALQKWVSVVAVWGIYGFMFALSLGKINLKPRAFYVTLGALTYPLYLIHNMAGKTIIDAYSKYVPESLLIVFVILFMVMVSWCIHQWVEKPLAAPLKQGLNAIFCSLNGFRRRF